MGNRDQMREALRMAAEGMIRTNVEPFEMAQAAHFAGEAVGGVAALPGVLANERI